jgi:hypothetical protein
MSKERLSKVVMVRLTPTLEDAAMQRATKLGFGSLAAYVRGLLVAAQDRDIQPPALLDDEGQPLELVKDR